MAQENCLIHFQTFKSEKQTSNCFELLEWDWTHVKDLLKLFQILPFFYFSLTNKRLFRVSFSVFSIRFQISLPWNYKKLTQGQKNTTTTQTGNLSYFNTPAEAQLLRVNFRAIVLLFNPEILRWYDFIENPTTYQSWV